MIELKERIGKYIPLNDLEKIFFQLSQSGPFSEEQLYQLSPPLFDIQPDKGTSVEETFRHYQAFVAATSDNRYIPTSFYIPAFRKLYIRRFPRYMKEHTHYHEDALEIDMVLQGNFSQTIQDHTIPLKAGEILFISPKVRHTARIYTPDSVVFTIMIYDYVLKDLLSSIDSENNMIHTFLNRILYGNTYFPYLLCNPEFDADLAGMLMDLEENQENDSAHMNKYMEAGIQLFFLRILVQHAQALSLGKEIPRKDSDILNIMDYIETNYTRITMAELAKTYNYSPNYLSSLIKAKYGKSFHEILFSIKMQHAAKLLQETDLSITQIAEMTGFSEKSYFLKRFKQYFGVTTSEYKSAHGQSPV